MRTQRVGLAFLVVLATMVFALACSSSDDMPGPVATTDGGSSAVDSDVADASTNADTSVMDPSNNGVACTHSSECTSGCCDPGSNDTKSGFCRDIFPATASYQQTCLCMQDTDCAKVILCSGESSTTCDIPRTDSGMRTCFGLCG